MAKIKALTFREKQHALEIIFNQYRRAKIKLYCLKQTSFYPEVRYDMIYEKEMLYHNKSMIDKLNEHIDTKDELENVILAFDCIMETLTPETRRVMMNDFIEPQHQDWWYEYYSKSTYYRVKSRAMEEALFYLTL